LFSGVQPNFFDDEGIQSAAGAGYLEIVKLLAAHPAVDPSAADNLPILLAARNGHADVVEFLMTCPKVNPRDQEDAALQEAMKRGYTKVVELLLPPNTNELTRREYLLSALSENGGSPEIALLLLQKFEYTPGVLSTALHHATHYPKHVNFEVRFPPLHPIKLGCQPSSVPPPSKGGNPFHGLPSALASAVEQVSRRSRDWQSGTEFCFWEFKFSPCCGYHSNLFFFFFR
jgi:hypothetical protein